MIVKETTPRPAERTFDLKVTEKELRYLEWTTNHKNVDSDKFYAHYYDGPIDRRHELPESGTVSGAIAAAIAAL